MYNYKVLLLFVRLRLTFCIPIYVQQDVKVIEMRTKEGKYGTAKYI